jgi:aminopeptidase N
VKSWITLFLAFSTWSIHVRAEQPTAYHLSVNVSPQSGEVHVDGRVAVELENTRQKKLTFDLHRAFRITTLEVNQVPVKYSLEEYQPSPLTPTARRVNVQLPSDIPDEKVELSISYQGKLQKLPDFGTPGSDGPFLDDAITSERVELSYYSSWYPSFSFGARFDTDLEVSLPKTWKAACIGKQYRQSESVVRCTGHEVNDLVILASPRFKVETAETSSGKVVIYHTQLPEPFVRREVEETEKTLRFFTGRIGTPKSSDGTVKHVYAPRKLGQGGYARTGMIVTSEGRVLEVLANDPDASLLRGTAHEMGHFWWSFGAGQGDWLNETFAEYFSLLAVREVQGQEAFETSLTQRKNAVAELPDDAPAISAVPPSNDGDGYTIRYFKGAMMLDHFRRLMGDEAFYRASRDFYHQYKDERVGTAEFREFWVKALGHDQRWVTVWLDSKGGLPEAQQ